MAAQISALPTPPTRQDPTNFNDRADAFLSALPTFQSEANALSVEVNNRADNVQASDLAVMAATNITKWVSGTTYAQGAVVWSPINGLGYRRITASGSGTTDPSSDSTNYRQVNGTGNVSTDINGNLGLGVTPSAWGAGLKVLQVDSQSVVVGSGANTYLGANWLFTTGDRYIVNGFATLYRQNAGRHIFYTAPSGTAGNAVTFTQAMTLTEAGKLGVGTTGPNETIQASGTVGSIGVSGSNGFVIGDFGSDAGTFAIQAVSGRALRFVDSFAGTERARIDSSGNLLVGTTSSVGARIHVASTNWGSAISVTAGAAAGTCVAWGRSTDGNVAQFYRDASFTTIVGSISVTASTTAYNTSSDYRLKHDIAPMQNALQRIAALKPCTYKWNADGSDGEGFIAHELAEVCPQAVTGEKDAVDADGKPVYQGIDTSFLVATLTAAIQEQQKMIEEQQAAIAELRGRIEVLESK